MQIQVTVWALHWVILDHLQAGKKKTSIGYFQKGNATVQTADKKKKTSIGYFQQGNATVQAADKRLHGYYIQDIFKQ